MKHTIIARIAAASLALLPLSAALANDYDLVPLWETYKSRFTDTFYSIDRTQYKDKLAAGYVDHSVAAWLPCSSTTAHGPHKEVQAAGTIHANLGYDATEPPMSFACAQPADSAPFYRFYKGVPVTDHFYTTSESDAEIAYANGFAFERVEGYLLQTQVPGSLPLYRLSNCLPLLGACDLEHRYTLSEAAKQALVAAGWNLDRIEGYAFRTYASTNASGTFTGTVNNYTGGGTSAVTFPIQGVIPPKFNTPLKAQSRTNLFGQMEVNSTTRPVGATQQRLIFDLYTGNLFDLGTNITHVAFLLHGDAQIASDGVGGIPYQGLGVYFARQKSASPLCPGEPDAPNGQIYVELFGKVSGPFVDCNNKLPVPLLPNHLYGVAVTVTDGATLTYEIHDKQLAGQPILAFSTKDYSSWYTTCPLDSDTTISSASLSYCANPYVGTKFPVKGTGYYVIPVADHGSTIEYSGYYSNMYIQWLSASGTILSTQ